MAEDLEMGTRQAALEALAVSETELKSEQQDVPRSVLENFNLTCHIECDQLHAR